MPTSTAPPPGKVNLVLQGGGVKGVGLVGAIAVLEEAGYTFSRVAGASAGAIVGCLVAAGMPAPELYELMASFDYRKIEDDTAWDHLGPPGKVLSLLLEHGIYKGDYILHWLRDELGRLGVHTFGDLRAAELPPAIPESQRYRLVVMTSDVTRGQLLRLPWDYPADDIVADDQPVADAVRASMSIPFFFRPVTLELPHAPASTLVDGGMLSNYPIDTFDPPPGQPDVDVPTIGIKLSSRQPPEQVRYRIKGDLSLSLALIGTMQSWHDALHVDDPAVIAETIFVDNLGVNTTDFDIDRATEERLYESGRQAALTYLGRPPRSA